MKMAARSSDDDYERVADQVAINVTHVASPADCYTATDSRPPMSASSAYAARYDTQASMSATPNIVAARSTGLTSVVFTGVAAATNAPQKMCCAPGILEPPRRPPHGR
jgi:hypothetical protein